MQQINILGNLTADCRMGEYNGTDVANFAVAVTNRRTKEVSYWDCSLWGKLATALFPSLKKGQKVFVQGEFGTDTYNGNTKLTCNVNTLELCGGKRTSSQDDEQDESDDTGGEAKKDFDDEIPF